MSNNTEIESKQAINGKDPVITDLNMLIVTELASGKTQAQLAKELGVTPGAINHQKKRVERLLQLKNSGEIADPINNQRARLTKRLKKTDLVIGQALKGYKDGHPQLKLATDTALAINKGLGVLAEHKEAEPESFENKRLTVVHKLELASQYGAEIPQEIQGEYEIMDDKVDRPGTNDPETDRKQGPNSDNR